MKLIVTFLSLNLLYLTSGQTEDVVDDEVSTLSVEDELATKVGWSIWSAPIHAKPLDSPADLPALYQNRLPENPVVETASGSIKGFATLSSRKQIRYEAYVGIPYAKAPLGELRFKDPVAVDPWNDVLDATYERSGCLGLLGDGSGSEDCLFLNVYTPNKAPYDGLKAVLVFIPGGAFIGGSSNSILYSPDFLIEQDVVLVTLNYRLGPLGFLSLQNSEVPGNAGLKDQRLALEWIKNNIEHFGGDPNRITIQGESAGSASVSYHLLSPSSAGLFNGAILESGTALTPWAYTPPDLARDKAFSLGKKVGCSSLISWFYTAEKLVACLRTKTADELVKAQEQALKLQELFTLRIIAFIPTTEPDVPGAFITQNPWEQLNSGAFNHVPTIIGSNSAEGLLLYPALSQLDPNNILVGAVGLDLTRFVPWYEDQSPFSLIAPEIDSRIRKFYYPPGEIFLSRETCINIITDTQFLYPIQQTAVLLAQHSSEPVYNYWFTYDGPFGAFKLDTSIEIPGVSHADELGYLFNPLGLYSAYASEVIDGPAHTMINRLTTLWANFAKTGNPTPETNDLIPVTWKPFRSDDDYYYYNINDTLKLEQAVQKDHIGLWAGIHELIQRFRL